MLIFAKLKQARKLLNMTQKEIAEATGTLQKDVSLLETGGKEFIPQGYMHFLFRSGVDINSLYDDSLTTVRFQRAPLPIHSGPIVISKHSVEGEAAQILDYITFPEDGKVH